MNNRTGSSQIGVNNAATCQQIGTELTRGCSAHVPLPDCIKWLERYRAPPAQRPFVYDLIQQLRRYRPELGPNILKTIRRIETAA